MTRRGLGRGLDALLASTEGEAPGLKEVPIAAIRPNPYQPRRAMDAAELEGLASSIRAHGLIQPLVARADGDGYQLIAGERRWRAAQAAGLERVPIVVREADPRQMLALALVENLQRTDLDPIEAAGAYKQLMDEFGLTQVEVAELVGKSRAAIANTVRLLGLSESVQRLVSDGHLSEGHARALLALGSADAQAALARRAIAAGWTVRHVESEAQRLSMGPQVAAPRTRQRTMDPETAAAAQGLERVLGTRVQIVRRGRGGDVVIHFYSEEELAALYDRLVGHS